MWNTRQYWFMCVVVLILTGCAQQPVLQGDFYDNAGSRQDANPGGEKQSYSLVEPSGLPVFWEGEHALVLPDYSASVAVPEYPLGEGTAVKPAGPREPVQPCIWYADDHAVIDYTLSISPDEPVTHPMAIVGFILSFIPFVNILGVILCILSLRNIKAYPEKYKGRDLAILGILVGVILTIVIFIYMMALAQFIGALGGVLFPVFGS